MTFLDTTIIRDIKNFATSVYKKKITSSYDNINYTVYFPDQYKMRVIYTSIYRV